MVVSRRHCEINLDAGKVTVRDLESRNGTQVNGEPIEEAQLKPGDVLSIGPVKLVVQIDGVPENFDAYLQDVEQAEEVPDSGPLEIGAGESETPHAEPQEARAAAQNEQEKAAGAEARRKQEQQALQEAVKDLPEAELGGSQTEMLGEVGDIDFDEDFEL